MQLIKRSNQLRKTFTALQYKGNGFALKNTQFTDWPANHVIVITLFTSCPGQETAKGPLSLQVTLPPAHHV